MIDDGTTSRNPIVRVLGPTELVTRTGEAVCVGGKPAAVLAALALTPGEWVPTCRLVDLVWAKAPASATNNLKTYVWQLRRALAAAASDSTIGSRPGGYRLLPASGDLDAAAFAAEASRVGELLRGGHAAAVAARGPVVLSWWRGRPYDEIADHCVHPAFALLDEQRRILREALADAYVLLGQTAPAVELLTVLTADDPLRETAWVKLVDALRAAGRPGDALAAYQRARSELVRELGVEPGPQLAAAQRAVLDAAPAASVSPVASGWPTPHQLPRAVRLVGRDTEIRRLTGTGAGLRTVTGAAGVGKTALAVAVGHTLADHYPDGQLHVDLGAHTDPIGTAEALARLIRSVTGPAVPLPDSVDERAALWRSVSYGQRLLVLLDDVRDGAQLASLLPGTPECLVLATSRTRLSGVAEDIELRLTDRAGLYVPQLDSPLDQLRGRPAALTPVDGTRVA